MVFQSGGPTRYCAINPSMPELEVLVYTYWLAHGLSYRVVSRVFHVPKATVHNIIHRLAQNIWDNLSKAMCFPHTVDLPAVGQGLVNISGTPAFNNVVGAFDGSHIRIKPPKLHRLDYLNYKGFYSVNMQAICDSSGRFLDIYVGYPGSVHDTRIMKNSSFYTARRYPPTGYILLGDGGYPCLDTPICLTTPFQGASARTSTAAIQLLSVQADVLMCTIVFIFFVMHTCYINKRESV
ncbi:hypothetical protein DPEC_G00167930, partial [Dallia pectoralis]